MALFGGGGKKKGGSKKSGSKKGGRSGNGKQTQRKKTNVPKYPVRRVKELPAKPQKGIIYEKTVKGKNGKRKVGFVYTGKTGFGMWKIVYNKPA